jgi:hypothetical protein
MVSKRTAIYQAGEHERKLPIVGGQNHANQAPAGGGDFSNLHSLTTKP